MSMDSHVSPPGLGDQQFWGNTLLAADGAFLLGLSIIVTILGTQMYYRLRGQPVNNSVAGLVMGMCTGAIVFSDLTYDLFGNLPHRVIRLDSQVFYSLLIPPIVFYAGFSVKKKLFFKNLVTIAIFGILGCNLTAYLLSLGIYPILESSQIYSLPIGPNSTVQALTTPSFLPTPWEASYATLATNPTGSARLQALDAAQHQQLSQFESRSNQATQSSLHRRSLLASAQDTPHHTPWASSPQQPAEKRASIDADGEVLMGEEVKHRKKKLLSAAMRLGTVFSPTDNLAILHYLSPNTQPVLHSLMFGEGVMNDITAVIMLKTTALVPQLTWHAVGWSYWHFITLFSASSVMGVSAGLLSALLTKHFFSDAHHHTDREVILMTTMAATSYVGAVLAGLSGIVAVFFCGITMSHYTWHSISASARVMSVHNFRVLCSLSEVFLFIYAGLDTSAKLTARLGHPEDAPFLWAVIQVALAMVVLVAVVRALFVALAVAIVNLWRSYKFTMREAVIMWYGGLVRGSITTALAYSYLYTEERNEPGDEAVLLASVLVVVVSTVLVGGLSQEFMSCVTLPPAQSRLIEINLLPGMNQEDDTSVNSAAVLSSKLHKLWRKFDKAVLQRLFGGRDARMPTYFQSVAELNQRIMRVQDQSGDVPVPSMVPRHMPERYTVHSSRSSTDLSTVHTADFQGSHSYPHSLHSQDLEIEGEGAQYLDCSGTPSPRNSSVSISDLQGDGLLRMPPPHVSSDLVPSRSNPGPLSAHSSSLSVSGIPAEVTELPTTSSVIQQMEGTRSLPRCHSDPHIQCNYPSLPRSTSASSTSNQHNSSHSSNTGAQNMHNAQIVQSSSFFSNLIPVATSHGAKQGPSGGPTGSHNTAGGSGRRLLQRERGKSMSEVRGTHRAHMRPATPPIDGQEPPVATNGEQNGHTVSPVLCVNDPEASVFTQERQEHVASSSPCLPHAAAAAAAATPSPVLPISTDAQEPDLTTRLTLSVTTAETPNDNVADAASVAPSVAIAPATEEHDRVAQALREGFLGAAGAIAAEGEDKSQRDGDAAAQQPGSAKSGAQDKPPAGPSAALARLVKTGATAGHHHAGPSSARSEGVTSQTSERTAAASMARQGSRGLGGDGTMSTAQSMVADNLPEPYQPPASNATSEDVHVGLENQYSSYEDALLDVKHGGEDVDIPWEAYDEEDKRAAAGCRSAMTNTYKRH